MALTALSLMVINSVVAKKVLKYLVVVGLIVGIRGQLLAFLIGGHYRIPDFLLDTFKLLLLLFAWYAVFALLQRIFKKLIPAISDSLNKFSCAVLVFVLAFPCLLAAIQTHPQKIETKRIPKDLGREYESVALSSDGFKLSAWFLPSASSSYPCVLVAHGLNANKDNFLSIAVMLANAGFPVLVFDFRAHGDSGGSQFTIGYREEKDVKAAYDWLKHRFPERAVVGLGYSAGAAAMLRAANKYKIFDRLVLDSTFGRLERVALKSLFRSEGKIARLMWSLGAFWGKVFTGVDFKSFENETAIASLNPESIMLIHGLRDSVIPHTESESLLRATKNRGTIWLIPEADHLQGLGHPMYLQKVGNFLLSDSPSQSVQQ